MPLKRLKLSSLIVSDEGTNVRDEMRDETITEYGLAAKAKEKLPPLKVFDTGKTGYIVADGFHRFFGYEQQGIKEVMCDVEKGTREDAIKFALAANIHHGLRRTNADKRRVVQVAWKEFPDSSDRAIADMCKVSADLAKELKPHVLEAAPEDSENKGNTAIFHAPPKRKGKDGKLYSAPKRLTNQVPENPQNEQPDETPEPPKDEVKDETMDATGLPVPPEIVPFWDSTFEEANRLLNFISEVKVRIEKAQKSNEPAFREMDFGDTSAKLSTVYLDLKRIKPYAVCHSCNGITTKGCATCKGRGFVSQHYWDNCVDDKIKKVTGRI